MQILNERYARYIYRALFPNPLIVSTRGLSH